MKVTLISIAIALIGVALAVAAMYADNYMIIK